LKLSGRIVVWPANLDSTKSRKEGRKLVKGLAVQAPRLEEISEASKRLSLDFEPMTGKSRPINWWEKGGYLTVAKKGKRNEMLRSLAGEIKEIRNARRALEKDRR
jgi:signal recognition particle subunit SRP19